MWLGTRVSHHLKGVELPLALGPPAQFFLVPPILSHSKNMLVPHSPHLRKRHQKHVTATLDLLLLYRALLGGNLPSTLVMSGWMFCLLTREWRRLENLLCLDFFLEDFLLSELLGVVGRQVDKESEDPSTLGSIGVSSGPSSSSLLSSVLFREKMLNRFLNNDGFLIFFDFLMGFTGSSKIVSGSLVSESTP